MCDVTICSRIPTLVPKIGVVNYLVIHCHGLPKNVLGMVTSKLIIPNNATKCGHHVILAQRFFSQIKCIKWCYTFCHFLIPIPNYKKWFPFRMWNQPMGYITLLHPSTHPMTWHLWQWPRFAWWNHWWDALDVITNTTTHPGFCDWSKIWLLPFSTMFMTM